VERRFRLTRSTDFERVRRDGKTYAHPFLVLAVCPNPGGGLRVGVSAGRNVGGAVQRNRARRILRAAVRPLLASLPPGHDLVLNARPALLSGKAPQVRAALVNCLARAKLLESDA
jgi:ribonuclease P protein component